ncbi:MAG: 4-hydroxy-tetrahydrodipicolinate synthase [Ignavibacterium sp.]
MFSGTGTALITPFDNDLNVDYQALKNLIRFQIDNGVNTLIILGTTGEAVTIDDFEREKIIDISVSEVNKKIPVIIGTGTNNTKKVVAFNQMAEKYNVDGVLIVNPYYNKGTQKSLIEHYKFISERTSLPIILYNVPSRTGMNVLPETVIQIFNECKNVIAVKEACGDISQIAKLFANKPEDLIVYSGNDDQALPIMSLGGKGVISVLSNILPKETVELTNALLQNNYEEGRKNHNRLLQMMNLLFIEANPIPVKYAASYLGLCKNTLRLPLIPASEQTIILLKNEFKKLGY